jgi:hypothetical protein
LRPQHPEELKKLLEWASTANSVLEIGSRKGETLVDLAHAMAGKRIVAVDWPGHEGIKDDNLPLLQANVKLLKDEGFDVHLVLGDSHHPDTLAKVSSLGPYDLVFIDGDHSYKGVKQDWEYYGPLGKQVVFHDIVKPENGRNAGLKVYEFWAELKGEEFIAHKSVMGLGRIWNDNSQRP